MTTQTRDIRREGDATALATAGARLPVSLDPANWGYIEGLALIAEVLGAGLRFSSSVPGDSDKVAGRAQLVVRTGTEPELYFHNGTTATAWIQFMGGGGSAERAARAAGDRLTSTQVSSASAFQNALNAQRTSAEPLELVITARISGTRSGSPYSYSEGDVLFVPPMSDVVERRFNIDAGDSFPAIPEDGHEYILYGRDRIGSGGSNDPIRFWRIPNLVPNTPGTQSGIGRVLTVIGENDRDYAWRTLDVVAAVNAAVAAYFRDNPPSGDYDDAPLRARVSAVEDQTADLDVIDSGNVWAAAAPADASIVLFAANSAQGVAIRNRTWTPSDLSGGEAWAASATTPVGTSVILLRLAKDDSPTRFRYTLDGAPMSVYGHALLASDATHDYYNLGEFAQGLAVAMQQRSASIRTRYHGELAGRALEQVENEVADAASGSTHAQIGDASLTLLDFGDGRGVWTKEEILALRTIEPSTPFDSARVGGYGIGSHVSFGGVNYTAIASTTQDAAFDPAEWTRDAEQPTPYYQYSILTRLRNAAGLPSGDDDQWVMTIAQNPGHSEHSIQWLETSMQDTSKLELFQKDDTGHWVEPAGALQDGLVLFRFSIEDASAKQLFRNAADTRDVIRDNLHFLLGKATNIGNYVGLGVDVRITIGSQSIDPTTPRRVPHIPQPMLEGELVRLTEDDVPHPTAEQVYRFGPQSSDFNPNYQMVFPGVTEHVNVFGIALAGTFGGVLDRFGPDNRYRAFGSYLPDILRASGIRAIYVREDHPSRIYIRMARALVGDAEVDTLKFRLGAFDHDAQMVRWPYTTAVMVPVPDETTADVRTFYCEPTNASGPQTRNMYTTFVMLGADTLGSLAFSMLKGAGAWLHYNSVTAAVSFAEGSRYAEGFYEGQADGSPVRVYLPRNPDSSSLSGPTQTATTSRQGTVEYATDAEVDAEAAVAGMRVLSITGVFRAIARKVKNASTTVRGIVLLARNEDVDASETDTTRVPDVARVKRLVERLTDLRARYNQASTPVAGDRFFFTDENQAGDPVRYADFYTLSAQINAALGLASSDLVFRSGVLGLSDARRSEFGALAGADIWLSDEEDAPIAPTQANQDKILWRWWEKRAYINRPVHYSAPTLAKRALASSDLPVGYNWGGVHTVSPGGVNNNVWFDRDPNARGWRRRITNPFSTDVFWTPNFAYLGYFDTEAAAAAAASAYEDAHGAGSSTSAVYVVMDTASVITGLTDREPDEFSWVPISSEYLFDADNLDAGDAAKKKAFRAAIGAAAVFVGTTLPPATAINDGDWVIFTTDVSSGLVWRDFANNPLTSADAGDLGVYVGGRTWQRLGNMIQGPAKIRTQALTSAAAITWNVASGHTATLTLGVNTTLRISGGADGDLAFLKVKQDGTGSRTMALHSSILRFKDIAAPTLSTTANSVDLLMFVNDNGTWNYVGMR